MAICRNKQKFTLILQHCGLQPSSSRRWCQLTHLPNCSGFSISTYNYSNWRRHRSSCASLFPSQVLQLVPKVRGKKTITLLVAPTGSSEYGIFWLQKALGPEICHFLLYTTLQVMVPHQGCWELEKEQLRKSWELIVTSKNKLKYSMEKLQRMRSFQLVKKSWFACLGPIWERLDALCYRRFWEKVAARTSFV